MAQNSTKSCPNVVLDEFSKRMEKQMLQVNGLMLLNAIVMGVVVFIGVYAPRYRRHPLIGFIFQGPNTLFLPIVTIVAGAATIDTDKRIAAYKINSKTVTASSIAGLHNFLILVWTGLVIFLGISTSAVVAGDPREGRNTGPSTELLIKAIWVAYLIVGASLKREFMTEVLFAEHIFEINQPIRVRQIFTVLIVITLGKIYQKCRVFYVARGSFMLGRNPRLIVPYMAQLDGSQDTEQVEGHVVSPPSLIVMEGVPMTLQQQPLGYSYKFGTLPGPEHQQNGDIRRIRRKEGSKLVTLDKVWGLNDIYFLSSTPQAKDLCFSFALFKMLRCRFAKYTVSEAGFMKARIFFWHTYLLQGADCSRVFRVIADELSFLHDYYYSSMSIPCFHRQFLLARVVNQVLSISLCSYIFVFMTQALGHLIRKKQVIYVVRCVGGKGDPAVLYFGYLYFDLVPVYLVLAAVLFSEIRETVSFFCSSFTKVVLICNYVINTRCPRLVAFLFKHLRCKWLLDPWDDKMSQCKLLVFRPWQVSILLRRLFRLPNQKKVKVASEVKEAIFKALQGLAREQQGQALEHIRLPSSPTAGSTTVDAQSACDGKGAADTILAWHIATSIFEMKDPEPTGHHVGCKTAAVRLSQYCAYLVCYRPELLPDDAEWCETIHKAVSKDAAKVLAGRAATSTPEDKFQDLVRLLSADSNHEVLRHGARLAKELVKEKGWEALAQFWSEMILYVAPSENLDGHAEAISRGGELITLAWALLAHAGIVGRLDAAATSGDARRV